MDLPRLHPDTIEQVKERIDIVDVVSEHVVLRKRGKDFTGLCPFHDDKSPSFSVSPAKQFYYCFSCGAGGNAIKFLMELGKRSFSDVVLDLARRYQVQVQTLEPEQHQALQRKLTRQEQLFEVLALTSRFYEHALRQSQGQAALRYLLEQRRFKDETIQQFQLGYAPTGWDTLYRYLVEQKNFPTELVEQAGLILPRKSGEGYYDRFRDRLMIPIHDVQSRVVGFAGRSLGDDQPKYLNSPETELFDKGKLLFGLDKARAAIAKQNQAVVVEGYFDVIALHAVGIPQVVASMGTALSLHQIRQILRYTESKQIILNFDADAAGTKAATRAIGEVEDLAYRGEVQLRVLTLPSGKDPDEYLQTYSAKDYTELLTDAPLWLDWQIQSLIEGQDLSQADQFQSVVQAIVQLMGKLPNAALRTHYIHFCSELLAQGETRMALQLENDLRIQVKGQRWHGQSQKWEKPHERTLREAAEIQLLSIYIHCPDYRLLVHRSLRQHDVDFSFLHHRKLWNQILEFLYQETGLDAVDIQDQDTETSTQDRLAQVNILNFLRNRIDESSDETLQDVNHIITLNEKARLDICRPELDIRTAIACLEEIMCEKRRRHLLNSWEQQEVMTTRQCLEQLLAEGLNDPEYIESRISQLFSERNYQMLDYQKKIDDESHILQQLRQLRCVSATDLLQTPLVNYLVA